MVSNSKKVTYSAVALAISLICIAIAVYTPLSFSAFTISAVCYFVAFDKSGVVFGLLTIIASVLLSFLFGVNFYIILNVTLFVPYSVLAFCIRKLYYFKIVDGKLQTCNIFIIFRTIIMMVFGVVVFMINYEIANAFFNEVFSSTLIYSYLVDGGYYLGIIIFAIAMIPLDIVFSNAVELVGKKI